jgi:hypothetical protein
MAGGWPPQPPPLGVVATLAVQAKNSPHKTSSAARRYIRGQASEERRQAAGPDDPLSPELDLLIDLFSSPGDRRASALCSHFWRAEILSALDFAARPVQVLLLRRAVPVARTHV